MKTGYFGRATENGHKAKHTQVHIYLPEKDEALCGYKPHKTMQFQFCSNSVNLSYVECKGCVEKYNKIRKI